MYIISFFLLCVFSFPLYSTRGKSETPYEMPHERYAVQEGSHYLHVPI